MKKNYIAPQTEDITTEELMRAEATILDIQEPSTPGVNSGN